MQQRQQLSGERSSLLVTQTSWGRKRGLSVSEVERKLSLQWHLLWSDSDLRSAVYTAPIRTGASMPDSSNMHCHGLENTCTFVYTRVKKTDPPTRGWAGGQILTEKLKFKTPVENILYSADQIRSIRKSYEKRKAVSRCLVINAGTALSSTKCLPRGNSPLHGEPTVCATHPLKFFRLCTQHQRPQVSSQQGGRTFIPGTMLWYSCR